MADDDETRAQFEAAIAGAELDDLRRLTPILGGAHIEYVPRPELRKPRRRQPVLYRVTADLNEAQPRIWRTLDLRSDLSLDLVHAVLQGAFGWADTHLYRFSIGGGPFDLDSQVYVCPYDVEDGDVEGIPAQDVRLDETLQEPGDVLDYVYDYGDHWDLTLRLDAVLPSDSAIARCVGGERAGPPENCGGLRRQEDLAEVLPDPQHFDVAEVNRSLLDPMLLMRQAGVNPALAKLLQGLRHASVGDQLIALGLGLSEPGSRMRPEEFDAALRPVLWFLERAQGQGLALTSAGYLKPDDVRAASAVVPGAKGWRGSKNRETLTRPVLAFRQMLQTLGLLRKHKGRLVTTKAGARGLVDHGFLWGHIASRLVPSPQQPRFDREGSLVVLLCASSSTGSIPKALIVEAMSALGWERKDGEPLEYLDLALGIPVVDVFENLGLLRSPWSGPLDVSEVGQALAREVLLWEQ